MKKLWEDTTYRAVMRYFVEEEGIQTNRKFDDPSMEFHQATTGLVGESREVLKVLKQDDWTPHELIDECGDVCFYLAVLQKYLKDIEYFSNVDLSVDLMHLVAYTRKDGVVKELVEYSFKQVHELSLDLLEFSKKVLFQQKDFYKTLYAKEYCLHAVTQITPQTITAILNLCHFLGATPKQILVYNREVKLAQRYGDSFWRRDI